MSNTLAIAAVTETLSTLLRRVLENPDLTGATVSALAPDKARAAADTDRKLNLFLYQVALNEALANETLPYRNGSGDLVQRPTLALDLHYMLTAYGLDNEEVDAHVLLAHGMSLVHDNAILSRESIRDALDGAGAPLDDSDLADQFEQVKLSLLPLTDEDVVRLWTVFQTSYRLSVCYQASVVLIERPHRTRRVPPVREPGLTVAAVRRPRIDEVEPRATIKAGTLTLRGRELAASEMKVRFATGLADPAAAPPPRDTELQVAAPADLLAGPQTVQVVHPKDLGDGQPRPLVTSNISSFLLTPRVTSIPPLTVARGATLTLTVQPAVLWSQRVSLLLDDQEIAIPARPAPTPPATGLTNQVAFPIPASFPAGSYLLRVVVDGVESPLTVETSEASPDFGKYVAPKLEVT